MADDENPRINEIRQQAANVGIDPSTIGNSDSGCGCLVLFFFVALFVAACSMI